MDDVILKAILAMDSYNRGYNAGIDFSIKDFEWDQNDSLDLPSHELKNLVRGLIWRDEHFGGGTIREIAAREKLSDGFVGQCIFKTFELA